MSREFRFILILVQVSFVRSEDVYNIPLVENIRRQLMKDNYDYETSSQSDEVVVFQKTNGTSNNKKDYQDLSDSKQKTLEKRDKIKHQDTISKTFSQMPLFENSINWRADAANNVNDNVIKTNRNEEEFQRISKKDLLYYVDDVRLIDQNTTTAKYKLLKLKPSHPNRRSNSVRRIIQEETQNGVAILALDDEPIPPLELPKTRRQYMKNHGDIDSEDELVPGYDE